MFGSSSILTSRSKRGAAALFATTGAVGGAAVLYLYRNENQGNALAGTTTSWSGAQRQFAFWSRVFPVVADYYWNFGSSSPYVKFQKYRLEEEEYQSHRRERMRDTNEKHAQDIYQVMLDLKGLYIKLGQVLSVTALPIPEPYRNKFRTLQSNVPGWEAFDSIVKPVLEKELKCRLEDVFESIEKEPVGAASIGQAHKAKLKSTGEDVIVKVQYPAASWQVPADIQCVGDFLKICVWFGVVDESAARLSFDDFSRQFLNELEYDVEKQNLKEIHESSKDPSSPYRRRNVVVPSVYEDLCTNKVITMSYLPGPKLEEEARRQLEMLGIDTKQRIDQLVRRVTKNELEELKGSGDENDTEAMVPKGPASSVPFPRKSWKRRLAETAGNWVGIDSVLWAVRLARKLLLWTTAGAVYTVRIANPVLPTSWNEWAESNHFAAQQASRMNLTRDWIDALFDVHGHQIFQLGLFNGDPHPGNVILNEDTNELGLIDFGQCKRLTQVERYKVARLVLSVANHESNEQIAVAFRDLGVKTKNDSTEFLGEFARLMFGRFESRHMDHDWHKKLHKMDRLDYFPKELSMVYRTSLLLRGLAISLQVNAAVGEQWREHAQAAVEEYADSR